jgi:hypothetical protein
MGYWDKGLWDIGDSGADKGIELGGGVKSFFGHPPPHASSS